MYCSPVMPSPIAPRPETSTAVRVSAVALGCVLRSSFPSVHSTRLLLHLKIHLQKAGEFGLFFFFLLSVEIVFSIFFHSQSSFGCSGEICASTIF